MKYFNSGKHDDNLTNIPKINKATLEELYLEYFNNFLTVAYFAEYNNFSVAYANRVISIGRKLNHRKSKNV